MLEFVYTGIIRYLQQLLDRHKSVLVLKTLRKLKAHKYQYIRMQNSIFYNINTNKIAKPSQE